MGEAATKKGRIGAGADGASVWLRPLLLVAALVGLAVVAHQLGLGEQLGRLREWIGANGILGGAVFVLVYAGATVAAIPGSAMTVAAGALFGSFWGVVLSTLGANLGAQLAFLVARYAARGSVEHWLGKNERFRKLDQLTAEHGAIIVALTRLVPLFPFNLLNYGFGLTRVPFGTYALWTLVCMLPADVIYVVGADALTEGIAGGRVPWTLIAVVVAAAGLLALLIRVARRRLNEAGGNNLAGSGR